MKRLYPSKSALHIELHYGVVPFESLKEINLSKLLQLRTSFVKMSADANEDPVHFVTLAKNGTTSGLYTFISATPFQQSAQLNQFLNGTIIGATGTWKKFQVILGPILAPLCPAAYYYAVHPAEKPHTFG
ncbi:hypothetical protein Pelo_19254 [Pelomyxa schiedti]|nr:hypothetical protein Pelo_19254 [Pelomyxa schiedti]